MSRSRSNSNPFPLLRKKRQKDISPPPPPPPPPPRPPRNPARTTTRPSTSSGISTRSVTALLPNPAHSLFPTDSSLLRRNKSTGSKFSRPRSSSHSSPPLPVHSRPLQQHPHPQFSTADRTILEELKRSLSARDAQFSLKNVNRAKHHPYPSDQVPYPRSYARDVVDMDVWETAVCQQIAASLTFHSFNFPPSKVLDIGCGPGTWILDCARSWRNSHFVGLDIVPLHPDLHRVGSSDLASRITWVQANFLEGLPFPNEEFDFVHIKRIARGVPEDKWDPLLEEITRVMKPGAAFEMIEEDLFFPSAHRPSTDLDPDDDPASDPDKHSLTDSSNSPPTPPAHTPPRSISPSSMGVLHIEALPNALEDDSRRDKLHPKHPPPPQQRRRNDSAPALPLSHTKSELTTGLPPRNRRPSTARPPSRPSQSNASLTFSSRSSSFLGSSPSLPEASRSMPTEPMFLLRTLPRVPVNPSDHTVLERIYTEMHAARFINLAPLSLLANYLAVYFKNVRTHPPLKMSFPPRPLRSRTQECCGAAVDGDLAWDSGSDSEETREATRARAIISTTATARSVQSRRTPAPPPPPPPLLRRYGSAESVRGHGAEDGRLVSVRDGASPYVSLDTLRMSTFSPAGNTSFPLPMHVSSLPVASRFMAEDASAGVGVGVGVGVGEMTHGSGLRKAQRLPNPTMNFDLRTLNLHLAVRTTEVLACAEAMWEWVVEYQKERKEQQLLLLHTRSRSGSVDELGGRARSTGVVLGAGAGAALVLNSTDAVMDTIVELTRADFDGLLSQYDVDMRHHMAIGTVLRDEYSWSNVCLPPTRDGKASDSAYDEWEQWERLQQQQQHRRTYTHMLKHHAQSGPTESSDTLVPDANVGTNVITTNNHHHHQQRRAAVPLPAPVLAHDADYHRQPSDVPHVTPLCRSLRVFAAWKG